MRPSRRPQKEKGAKKKEESRDIIQQLCAELRGECVMASGVCVSRRRLWSLVDVTLGFRATSPFRLGNGSYSEHSLAALERASAGTRDTLDDVFFNSGRGLEFGSAIGNNPHPSAAATTPQRLDLAAPPIRQDFRWSVSAVSSLPHP